MNPRGVERGYRSYSKAYVDVDTDGVAVTFDVPVNGIIIHSASSWVFRGNSSCTDEADVVYAAAHVQEFPIGSPAADETICTVKAASGTATIYVVGWR
jgi:uncharacterized membrane protein